MLAAALVDRRAELQVDLINARHEQDLQSGSEVAALCPLHEALG